jgi:hypothetical protein
MSSFYEPPATRSDARPAVIVWFRVYAATLAVLYAGAAWAAWPALGALSVFYVVATLLPLRPWSWTVGLVAIAIGIPSVTIVFALPLLLKWRSPITRAAFGRPPI